MPRYYFNLGNHLRDEDHEGTVLANDDEARVQAVVFAGDYVRNHPELVEDGLKFRVTVVDQAGTVLLNVVVTSDDPNVKTT